MTKAELLALLDGMGAQDDTVLTFFVQSEHYVEDGVLPVIREFGFSQHRSVYVKAVA